MLLQLRTLHVKERSMVKSLLFISCLPEAVHVSVNPSLLGYNSSCIIIIICWDMGIIYICMDVYYV